MPVDVFKGMNERQREAVAHINGPLSVIAGAGSGKTRVITHRIANIIQHDVRPDHILAITFTNKAAGEMQERVERLLGMRTPWITTFHSAGLRILKLEQDRLGLAHPFTILDDEDQKRMFKRIVKELDFDSEDVDPGNLRWQVSQWKNRLQTADMVAKRSDYNDEAVATYKRYAEICKDECVLDFDDLLLLPVMLFRGDDELKAKYQEKFPYILIDEYQDTNEAQYQLIRLLGEHQNVCATGDPDQAIYGWRGADIRNILQFERDFPGCTSVLLEQNYRSTKVILRAAQSVVEHNENRKDKSIFTDNAEGKPIRLITVGDQDDEAMAVAAAVDRMRAAGRTLSDIAVFYRTNAQSRTLEEWLIRRGVPYRIVGGTRFYDRKEVKDLLAYCKLLINPRDLVSLQRILNVPRRGIGDKTFNLLRDMAYQEGVSVHDVLTEDQYLDQVAVGRSSKPLRTFATLLRRLHDLDLSDPGRCVDRILELTGLEEWVMKTDDEQGAERAANLREMITAADQYDGIGENAGLEGFLDHISLLTSADNRKIDTDELLLMTLHASKGLEFPVVFITGCEQGVLPLVRQGQPCDYEEERRLMYVGITRAMEELYISRGITRTQFGRTQRNPPSMFLAEIPDDCIFHKDRTDLRGRNWDDEDVEAGPAYPATSYVHQNLELVDSKLNSIDAAVQQGALMSGAALRAALQAPGSATGEGKPSKKKPIDIQIGDRLVHGSFGPGVVVELSGPADDQHIVLDFDHHGRKELLLNFARARLKKS